MSCVRVRVVREEATEEKEEKAAGAELKTKTPHKDVGNKQIHRFANVDKQMLLDLPLTFQQCANSHELAVTSQKLINTKKNLP